MKYDSDTAKVDRWHSTSKEDMARGYSVIPTSDKTGIKDLDGGMQPRDDELQEQSD